MKKPKLNSLVAGLFATAGCVGAMPAQGADEPSIARGKYLAEIAGCNDCHTPGYMEAAGKVPTELWFTGDSLGWYGPWGTTYAPNLRLYLQKFSEDEWVSVARNLQVRPPMPWFNLNAFAENDLRSFYRFVHSLGPAGQPAPAYLPPGQVPPQPYIAFTAGPGS